MVRSLLRSISYNNICFIIAPIIKGGISELLLPFDVCHAYLLCDELISIGQKLSPYPFSNKILNKIKGSYQRGINEKIEFIVNGIGLKISKVEKEALQSRNAMAHDSILIQSEHDAIKWIKKSRAYQTLLNEYY